MASLVPTAQQLIRRGCIAVLVALLPLAYAGGQSVPHGDATGTCTFTEQTSYPNSSTGSKAQLSAALQTLISGITSISTSDTRDLTNGSLAGFEIGNSNAKTQALTWVESAFQTLDNIDTPNGNVWFNLGKQTSGNDPNATEFAMMGLSVMMGNNKLTIADILNDTGNTSINKTTVVNNISIALKTEAAHTIAVTYTNMYLMNTTSRLLMDQALQTQGYNDTTNTFGSAAYTPIADQTAAENQLVSWLTNVQTNGVNEFDSPTYSGTDFESLVAGVRFAKDANTKANFTTALDYIWLDLASSWFNGNLRIAPPYSRNYSFTVGHGELQPWIEGLACWTTTSYTMGGAVLEHATLMDIFNSSHGYQLPSATYQLGALQGTTGSTHTHTVYQKWGSISGDPNTPMRVASVFNNVSFGCAGGNYGPQDTMFGSALSGSTTNSSINYNKALMTAVLDSSGNPFGTVEYPDSHGHMKTEHLTLNTACSQSGNASLVTFNIDGTQRMGSTSPSDIGLFTNILLPFNVNNIFDTTYPTVAINGTAVNTLPCVTSTQTATVSTCTMTLGTDVLTVQGINGGVIGFKFVENGWYSSTTPQLQFEIDRSGSTANPTGKSNEEARLVLTHSTTTSTTGAPTEFRVAMLVAVDDTATSPTSVYNILHNATFTDNPGVGDPTQQVFKAAFNASYMPANYAGSSLEGLQVIRSRATLVDSGKPYENTAGSYVLGFEPTDALTTIDGAHTTTTQAANFWTTHTILTPGP